MSADSVMGGSQPGLAVVVPALYPHHEGRPRKLGPAERFALSACAPAVAVFFTNPFDTVKVRLQLQGQRAKAVKSAGASAAESSIKATADAVIYRNSFDAIHKILRNEGIRGLQKGLFPAILKEGSKNFFRIGMYDPFMTMIHDPKKGSSPPWKRMLAGSMCGVMGAFSCNPFELIKTRLQSQVSAANAHQAVGHQFQYKNSWDALVKTYTSDGLKGLYRGSVLSMARSFVGSGVNLTTYSMMKEYLILKRNWKDDWVLDMVAGLGSGIASCIAMNPIDVVRTRYYNQPYVNGKGTLYSSGTDALAEVYNYMDMRDSFRNFDQDGNGVLDRKELADAMRAVLPNSGFEDAEYEKMIRDATMRVLEIADQDKDTVISFEEYPRMTEEVQKIYVERAGAASLFGGIRPRSMKSFGV
ncbi:hypothetical protein CcCBS67573_g01657 [Chytriomyces confervae]|uniref:EF-hand domain-containing protein n=1 Tax=Chytriomyces confervae TaxID=246404 RepID=A0A507FPX4_9FUNG|nr:hypothetical protein HDU80_006856 [Chytriomyces hyalinus]TPX77087.1 hypothetical protein CcCBS67573_g01657 [Chytriomyces confervae]